MIYLLYGYGLMIGILCACSLTEQYNEGSYKLRELICFIRDLNITQLILLCPYLLFCLLCVFLTIKPFRKTHEK